MIYTAEFHIDVGKAIPAIGDLIERINAHLARDGHDEKLKCHAPIISIDVSVNRELKRSEQETMKRILETQMIEAVPEHDIRLVYFRRKSGNASQSAVQ